MRSLATKVLQSPKALLAITRAWLSPGQDRDQSLYAFLPTSPVAAPKRRGWPAPMGEEYGIAVLNSGRVE